MKANVATPSSQVKRERYGLAFGMCAAVIWGGYLAVTRQGIAAGLTAADLSFLRYSTAGLIMLPWLLRHNPLRLGGIGWGKGSALALLAGPPFVLVGASGFSYAPLAHSAVIQLGTLTLMGIALSVIMIGERTSKRRLAGVAIILTGLAVTAGPALLDGRSDAWKGDLLFATAGSMWALFTVLQLRWRITPVTATAVVSVLSGLVYSLFYLSHYGLSNLMRADTSMLIQQALVLGVLSGVVALFTFSRTVEYLGAARASLFPAFAPAIAILIGIPLTNEIPTLWQMVGLVILSVGLLLAIQAPKAGSPTPP